LGVMAAVSRRTEFSSYARVRRGACSYGRAYFSEDGLYD
jgi:hypothetical protein